MILVFNQSTETTEQQLKMADKMLSLVISYILPVAAGWVGVVSTIIRSARPVLGGWGAAAGWVWITKNKDDKSQINANTAP